MMATLQSAVTVAMIGLLGCGAGTRAPDGDAAADDADAELDGGADASRTDDGGARPDARAVRPVLCGDTLGAVPGCPTQTAGAVTACEGSGAVVFDGASCALASGAAACSSPQGAFDSFEACASACAAEGHCDRRKLAEWVGSCDRLWLHPAYPYSLPDTACGLVEAWTCEEPAPEPDYGTPHDRCWRGAGMITDELQEHVCALTLMPSIHQVFCFNEI